MPRYFFDIHHDKSALDREGEELPDKHAAWKEAAVIAGRILQDLDGDLRPGHDGKMEVTDDFRERLFVLYISARMPS